MTKARFNDLLAKTIILALVVVPLVGTVLALRALWDRAAGWDDVVLMVVLYIPISLGITVGFHRYLTHRGFQAHPAVKVALLILGSMAVEGSAISWAANHRKHHALSDQKGDPHSPVDGFWHAHIGWLFEHKEADRRTYAKDLLADRTVMWVSKTFVVWVILTFLIPFLIGGWEGLLWGGFVRAFLTHHVTWSVNSVCHTFGKRPFVTKDRSRNQWVVGLLALGEGWHNNHHAFQQGANHGLWWWQFDLSKYTIRALQVLRLASDVKWTTPDQIAARLRRDREASWRQSA